MKEVEENGGKIRKMVSFQGKISFTQISSWFET